MQAVGGEVAMMLLPAAAEAMKECVLECTFLSGVADAAMETLLRAGSIVPIFGEVCMCVCVCVCALQSVIILATST